MTFLWLLEKIRTPLLDDLMQFITYFGQEMVIIAVICTLYWCVDKRFAYLLGFNYFTAGLCVQVLKITFRVPRPWILDPDFHAVKSALPGATGYSFPSGHTQGATSLFFPLALRSQRKGMKILYVLAFILIGFSRMYLGCHTPKDVLVSMGLSMGIALIIWRFQSLLLDNNDHLTFIACLLAGLSLAVAAYALFLNGAGTIETTYAEDCCKAAGAGMGFALGWYIERRYLNFRAKCRGIFPGIARLFVGLAAAFALKETAGLILGSSVLAKMAEYFILVLWVLIIYPYLFHKMQRSTL